MGKYLGSMQAVGTPVNQMKVGSFVFMVTTVLTLMESIINSEIENVAVVKRLFANMIPIHREFGLLEGESSNGFVNTQISK